MTNYYFKVGDWFVDDETFIASKDGTKIKLTAREFMILRYLSRRIGQVVARAELAGHGKKVSRAVDVNISRLKHKLDLSELEVVWKKGYRLRDKQVKQAIEPLELDK